MKAKKIEDRISPSTVVFSLKFLVQTSVFLRIMGSLEWGRRTKPPGLPPKAFLGGNSLNIRGPTMSELFAVLGVALPLFAVIFVYLLYKAIRASYVGHLPAPQAQPLEDLLAEDARAWIEEQKQKEEQRQDKEDARVYDEMASICAKYGFKIAESRDIVHNRYHQSARRFDRMSSKKPIIVSTQKPNPSATDCKTFTVLKSR